jgi:hypothetical protein
MFHYIAVLKDINFKRVGEVTIEIERPISQGELVSIDESTYKVLEVKHVITNSGHTTYLDCKQRIKA